MLYIVDVSLIPLIGFSLVGLFIFIFPGIVLNLQNFNSSMKGSLFNNNLQFSESALGATRIVGLIFVGAGIFIFLLVNGYLESLLS